MFRKYLNVVLVNSEEMLDRAFHLRFQVYCLERGFENRAAYPDGRERDVEDHRSLHSLLLDRASGSAVGTVRLILPRRGRDLPVFRVIGATPWTGRINLESCRSFSVSVAKAFRRQLEEAWCQTEPCTDRAGASSAGSRAAGGWTDPSSRDDECVRRHHAYRRHDGAGAPAFTRAAGHCFSLAWRTGPASWNKATWLGCKQPPDHEHKTLSSRTWGDYHRRRTANPCGTGLGPRLTEAGCARAPL